MSNPGNASQAGDLVSRQRDRESVRDDAVAPANVRVWNGRLDPVREDILLGGEAF